MQLTNAWASAMVAGGRAAGHELSHGAAAALIGRRCRSWICWRKRRSGASGGGFRLSRTHASRAAMSQLKMRCRLWTSATRAGAAVQRLAF